MVKDSNYLNSFNINGLREAPKGEVKFDVTMELDKNGILKIKVNEINGNHSKSMVIKGVNDLSPEKIKWFKEQKFIFQNDDKLYKQKVEAKEKLLNFIYERKRQLENNKNSKNLKVIQTLEETENWLKNQNLSITQITNKLNELSKI